MKQLERHCFLLFILPKTDCINFNTPNQSCGKTVYLTYILQSMFPEIIHKILLNVWKIKEKP